MSTTTPATYLVELMNPLTGELEQADICVRLDTAVEQVFEHLQDYPEVPIDVEASYDEDGELEGIGFFDDEHEMASCITVYHLDRDVDKPQTRAIAEACLLEGSALEGELTRIFSL